MSAPSRPVRRTTILVTAALLVWSSSCTDAPTPTATPSAVAPTLAVAAGATSSVLVGAGDIASCSSSGDDATAKLLDGIAGTVFTLGDNITASGSISDFNDCYNGNWGRHKARTKPAPGEKDYLTPGASGYFSYFGAAAGDPAKGYYSYNLGAWHIVVLNSGSGLSMSATSAQAQWLRSDLTANRNYCTLAYWHHPLFYSGGPRLGYTSIWNILYDFGADLILNSHPRNYERLAPMTPGGALDPDYGIRTIIAGTGGTSHGSFGVPDAPNIEVRDRSSYGVLKLTLSSDSSYAWQFVPVAGATFRDAGTARCHGTKPPVAKPGGPYATDGTITLDASASFDPAGNIPLTYDWNFGDGTTGTGVTPTHTYASRQTYTVTLTVSNAVGDISAPATTTVEVRNFAPVVSLGPDATIQPTWDYDLWGTFTDVGLADGPWTYSITWGDGASETGTAEAQATRYGQTATIASSHRFSGSGSYQVAIAVADKDGATGVDTVTVTLRQPGASSVIFSGAGDIGECGRYSLNDDLTANILDTLPGKIFTIGDNAYPDGTDADFANCYEPTWGRQKARTYPVSGNHEYDATPTAEGYFNYFNGPGNFTGPAGDRGKGYYSFDYGNWHMVVLNDNIPTAAGSPQEQWLRADLSANSSARCTMAFWHKPKFYGSGSGQRPGMISLWQPLYDAGADVILAGHQHYYMRFAQQRPDGTPSSSRGIRQFIIGTGGSSIGPQDGVYPNVETQNGDTYGVMKFTLEPDGYWWDFIPAIGAAGGGRFTDRGYTACHDPATP